MEKFLIKAKSKGENKSLQDVLDSLEIKTPHPSLGFFHFIYSPIEEANLNGVRLASDAVDKSINQLKLCQANINHERQSGCGAIAHAWRNTSDEIEIVIAMFKNLYPEDYAYAKELEAKGKLFVSFELCAPKVEKLSDGTRRVLEIEWEGVGLLLDKKPAYPNARLLESASEIVNQVFNKSQEFIFASATPKDVINKMEQTSKQIEDLIKSNKEDNSVNKKAQEALLAKFREDLVKELGEEAVNKMTTEQIEAELQKRANMKVCPDCQDQIKDDEEYCGKCGDKRKKDKQMAEEKAEQEKKDKEAAELKIKEEAEKAAKEAAEQKQKEDALKAQAVNRKTTTTVVYDVTEDEEAGTMEVIETTTIQEEKDGQVVKDEKVVRNTVYSQAKMEAMKAEYENKLKAKDEEIKNLSSQVASYQGKEKAEKVALIRAELGDFVKDLSDEQLFDENKIEIAKLKKENAELKASKKVETASTGKTILETGHEKDVDELDRKIARKEVIKAAGKVKK